MWCSELGTARAKATESGRLSCPKGGSQTGVILPPGNAGQCLQTFLNVTTWGLGVPFRSSELRPEMLQHTGQALMIKHYPFPIVTSG